MRENGTDIYTRAHTEKFIPENRGCVSTSMAAGRSMHSPPPELTDAGRRGGQPLHARCHRNALSLKHRLIITDARPFSLSPSSAAIFTPPLGYPVGEPEAAATTHSPFLTAFSSLPRSLSLPVSPSRSLRFPGSGHAVHVSRSVLLAGSGRVRDDGNGGDARRAEVGRRGGSFHPSGDVLALKLSLDRELHD